MAKRQIVAMGGGGFLVAGDDGVLDEYVLSLTRKGKPRICFLAGMLCWFEGGVTDSFGRPLSAIRDGLGLLKGSACPHYDGETDRRPIYHQLLRRGLAAGVAADDWAAIHYVGLKIHACIGTRPNARCYRVGVRGGVVREEEMKTRNLGP